MKMCPATDRLKAFTLIEVLAAMTVLVILMMALVRIFTEASAASQKANVTVNRNAAARVALAMIRDDLQGAIVDHKLALYKEANTFEGDFDRICFITLRQVVGSSPSSTNDYAYLQVQYYVTNAVVANSSIVYTNWVLKRSTRYMETARRLGVDALTPAGKQWWKNQTGFEETEVIDNVIRFDVWICNEAGVNADVGGQGSFGGDSPFDSSLGAGNMIFPDQPPAYIDVYLQVTSDDAMKRGALAKAAGQLNAAFATFYREADVLMTRITSSLWTAERAHPLNY